MTDVIGQIIDAIWKDICSRSGFDIDDLDYEVQSDIKATWRAKIDPILYPQDSSRKSGD